MLTSPSSIGLPASTSSTDRDRLNPPFFTEPMLPTNGEPLTLTRKSTTRLASLTVPVTDGSFVSASVELEPVSFVRRRVKTGGVRSGAVPINVFDSSLVLPAASIAITRKKLGPLATATPPHKNLP